MAHSDTVWFCDKCHEYWQYEEDALRCEMRHESKDEPCKKDCIKINNCPSSTQSCWGRWYESNTDSDTTFNVDWIEKCTLEDAECGRYDEGCETFNNYKEALKYFNRLKLDKENRYVTLSRVIYKNETLESFEATCDHDFKEKHEVRYGEDEKEEYLIYVSMCIKCGEIKQSDRVYICPRMNNEV